MALPPPSALVTASASEARSAALSAGAAVSSAASAAAEPSLEAHVLSLVDSSSGGEPSLDEAAPM